MALASTISRMWMAISTMFLVKWTMKLWAYELTSFGEDGPCIVLLTLWDLHPHLGGKENKEWNDDAIEGVVVNFQVSVIMVSLGGVDGYYGYVRGLVKLGEVQ
ncbi:hypothetical protein Fot_38878 [Forsythia ovata]|uniref:Uncharacterized protein n=1 Tax=Forsythia ovata TaxID=205694 RepID=A0ABD1S3S7_9LAMI